jgi:choline dehydrogenase
LLVEAGGSDDVPEVQDPLQWPANIGSERDWAFASAPEEQLNGRSLPLSMGKVLGGGSSINVLVWARGHRSDWDYYAKQTKDSSWSYASVLKIYKRIEDWHGTPDPAFRGSGGPVFVQPPQDPGPLGAATLEAAKSVGIPVFESQDGLMMEGDGGAARMDLIIKDGQRRSIYRAYVAPFLD